MSRGSLWRHALAGLFTALTFYIYVFCYLSLYAVCGLFYLLNSVIGSTVAERPRKLLEFVCYVLSAGIFVLPGLMNVPHLSQPPTAIVQRGFGVRLDSEIRL